MSVFMDCRVEPTIQCPGDGGYSDVVLFGRHVRVRKDHPAIELMGVLDEAEAIALHGYVETGSKALAEAASVLAALNTYLATGRREYLDFVEGVVRRHCGDEAPAIGWLVPMTKEASYLNLVRAFVRRAERVAVRLAGEECPADAVQPLIAALNHVSKYAAQLALVSGVSVFKSINDKLRALGGEA